MINYFEVLNVSENAEMEVIKASYKALVKKYHPDNSTLPIEVTKEKMAIINEAFKILSDNESRKHYLVELHHYLENERAAVENAKYHTQRNEDDMHIYNDFSRGYGENLLEIIIIIVVIVSVICCVFNFVPDLLNDAWNNIVKEFEEIISTF